MKFWLKLVTGVVVVLGAHTVLLWWLQERNVVATVLSAGPHSPPGALLVAGAFVVVRLLAVLLLPATVLARLGCWAIRKWQGRHEKS